MKIKSEKTFLPEGEYIIGCPYLVLNQEVAIALDKTGIGEYNGHKYFSIKTDSDSECHLYDTEELDDAGNPADVDVFYTDVGVLSIIPLALIADQEAAEEEGRLFAVETYNEDGNEDSKLIEITVNSNEENGKPIDVDIEWYKLVTTQFHPDKRFSNH